MPPIFDRVADFTYLAVGRGTFRGTLTFVFGEFAERYFVGVSMVEATECSGCVRLHGRWRCTAQAIFVDQLQLFGTFSNLGIAPIFDMFFVRRGIVVVVVVSVCRLVVAVVVICVVGCRRRAAATHAIRMFGYLRVELSFHPLGQMNGRTFGRSAFVEVATLFVDDLFDLFRDLGYFWLRVK